eukprot:jgi/Chlat1/4434/Chrsp29S00325
MNVNSSILSSAQYPLRGFAYLLSHRRLWGYVAQPLLVTLAIDAAALVVLLIFALPVQASLLEKLMLPPWLALIASLILVLAETAGIALVILDYVFAYVKDALFQKVYSMELSQRTGQPQSVRPKDEASAVVQAAKTENTPLLSGFRRPAALRTNRGNAGTGLIRRITGELTTMTVVRPVVYLASTVLNAVPIVGTLIFAQVNGLLYAWDLHEKFLREELGLRSREQQERFINAVGGYNTFGRVAVLLELPPAIGLYFKLSNVVGAALWAVDLREHYGDEPDSRADPPASALDPSKAKVN